MSTEAEQSARERGIVDAHVHFWDPDALRYPWLDALPSLQRAYLPETYREQATDVPVARGVFVEGNASPSQYLDEVAFASRFADARPHVAAIVAFADLAHGDAAPQLDALCRQPLVRGVRQNIQGQPAGFCRQLRFLDGVREVGRRGLTFDLCATHDQLGEVLTLVDRCPDVRFVLDHCGKPPIAAGEPSMRAGQFDAWSAHVAAIARHENVVCKLSGLFTEAGADWHDVDLVPYAEHVVNAFGPPRVMYGSDWPVLTLAGTHAEWFRFTERVTGGWSDADRRAFYHDTAARTYGL